ncbi:MAG: pyridoxal-phosphate dependent enzyme [Proteobacteria bacterium]|nr:pyridoxal-phosphate dependent enzyme [Pseudomonadota bacterium]
MTTTISLFKKYPRLENRLPRVSLASLPTPVERLEGLEKLGYGGRLYIKRDDLSGELYGGNKTRKLEFLLGQVQQSNKKRTVTFGAAGSNHATATAVYGKELGLECHSMLMPQPNSFLVRKNLLVSYDRKAHLQYDKSLSRTAIRSGILMLRQGGDIAVIPAGGSSPLGVCGFVNAAFELKEQIDSGELPEPDYIYVAAGTLGTTAGLILGLKALGLKSRVIPVRVVDLKLTNRVVLYGLLQATNQHLISLDPAFPRVETPFNELFIENSYFGDEYGLFTERAVEAIEIMQQHQRIRLEGTYTGKTFAAFLNDAKRSGMKDKTVLFWNTFNSRDLSKFTAHVDYRDLPEPFHAYFTEDVQPLDSSN